MSGPNMMTYGEAFENSSACSALLSLSSFKYAPPQSRPSARLLEKPYIDTFHKGDVLCSFTSYCTTKDLPLLSMTLGNLAEIAWCAATFLTTVPVSSVICELGVQLTQSLVALNTLEYSGLLDGPLSDVCPLFLRGLVILLLRVADLPPAVPIIGELLKEWRLQR